MQAVKDILPAVLKNLQGPLQQKRSLLIEKWAGIAGPAVSAHTKPELGKNGELFIWVDQAALAYELNQRYKQTLLKRAQAELGQEEVKSIRFCVGQLR